MLRFPGAGRAGRIEMDSNDPATDDNAGIDYALMGTFRYVRFNSG